MFLQDVDVSLETKINKIGKFLEDNFGVRIDENSSLEVLRDTRKSVQENMEFLKFEKNMTVKDPEYAKTLMIIEGIDYIISKKRIDERAVNAPYFNIIKWLADTALNFIELGDEIDDAIKAVMREYRSSKWRFPDYEVEYDVEKTVMSRLPEVEERHRASMLGDSHQNFLFDDIEGDSGTV